MITTTVPGGATTDSVPSSSQAVYGDRALLRLTHLQRFVRAKLHKVRLQRARAESFARFFEAEAAAFHAAAADAVPETEQGITPESATLSPASQRTPDEPVTPTTVWVQTNPDAASHHHTHGVVVGDDEDTPLELHPPRTAERGIVLTPNPPAQRMHSADWRQLVQPIELDIAETEPDAVLVSSVVAEAAPPGEVAGRRSKTPITTAVQAALAQCDGTPPLHGVDIRHHSLQAPTTSSTIELSSAQVEEELLANTARYGERAIEVLVFEEAEGRDEVCGLEQRKRRQCERQLQGALQLSHSCRALVLRWKVADLQEMQQTLRARIVEAEAADLWFIMEHHAQLRGMRDASGAQSVTMVPHPPLIAARGTLSKRLSILLHNESSMRIQHQRSEEVAWEEIQLALRRQRMACDKMGQLLEQVESHEGAFRAQVMREWAIERAAMERARQDRELLFCEHAEAAERVQIQRDEIQDVYTLNVNAIIDADVLRRVSAIASMEGEGRRRIAEVAETVLAFIRECLWERQSMFGDVQRAEAQRRMDLVVREMDERQALWRAAEAILEVLTGRRDDLRRSSTMVVEQRLRLSHDSFHSVAASLHGAELDVVAGASPRSWGPHDAAAVSLSTQRGEVGPVRSVEQLETLYRERWTKQEALAFQWLARHFAVNLVHALSQSEMLARDEVEYEEALAMELLRRRCARLGDDAARITRLREAYAQLNRKYSLYMAAPLTPQRVQKMLAKLLTKEANRRQQLQIVEQSYRDAMMEDMAADMPLWAASVSSSVALWRNSTSTLVHGRNALSSFRHTVHSATNPAGRSDRVARILDVPGDAAAAVHHPPSVSALGHVVDMDSVLLLSTTSRDDADRVHRYDDDGPLSPSLPSPKMSSATARAGRGGTVPQRLSESGHVFAPRRAWLDARRGNTATQPPTMDDTTAVNPVVVSPAVRRSREAESRPSSSHDALPLPNLYFGKDRLHLSQHESDSQTLDEVANPLFYHCGHRMQSSSDASSILISASNSMSSMTRLQQSRVPAATARGVPALCHVAAPTAAAMPTVAVHFSATPPNATASPVATTQVRLSTRQPAGKPRERSTLHCMPPFMVTVDDVGDLDEYNFSEIDM